MPAEALRVTILDEIEEFARELSERIESAAWSEDVYYTILSGGELEGLRPEYTPLKSADIVFLSSAVHDKVRARWDDDLVALCRLSDRDPTVVVFSGRGEPQAHGADLFLSRYDIRNNTLAPSWFEVIASSVLAKRIKRSSLDANLIVPAHQSIIAVNERLADLFRRKPDALWDIHPRRFEELIAELFEAEGYSVILTPQSRDGGKDLYAFKKDHFANLCYLVECKRFRPPAKVGVPVVRQLFGVVQDEKVSGGIVVSTSYFTKEAKSFALRAPYQLFLRDYNDLLLWLEAADKTKPESTSVATDRGTANPALAGGRQPPLRSGWRR